MSTPTLIAVVWAIVALCVFGYLRHKDATDTSLSEDERAPAIVMAGCALGWPVLAVMWVLTAIITGLRRLHSWLAS